MEWDIDDKFAANCRAQHLKFCRPLYEEWARARHDLWLATSMDPMEKYDETRKMTSALGGKIGNDSMRMLRKIAIYELKAITTARGADMTPTLARNILREMLGRSVDDDVLIANFATEGRTAANKTTWKVDDFDHEISAMQNHILWTKFDMRKGREPIREHYKIKYAM